MRKPLSLSHVARRPGLRVMKSGQRVRWVGAHPGFSLAMGLFLVCLFLSACSSPFGGGAAAPTPTSSTRALSSITWCAKPVMVFRDEGASTTSTPTGTASATSSPAAGTGTPQTINDWAQVKDNLGFTVFLPKTLPNGTCLVSAQATIHDPIFGGNFSIGYLLPDHTSLSLSEAPLKSQNTSFQCNSTSSATPTATTKNALTPTPTTVAASQLCSGAKDTTNIVLSGAGTDSQLQQIFTSLQPNINWIPAA